jgi:hypothetical protein
MAILHHVLVLFSAFLCGKVQLYRILDFVDYLVLGDDIVIADHEVAQAYVALMKRFHIPIGLAKSHISEFGMFNFANQTFVEEINVSPISMREELNAKGLPARIALVMRTARRGWKDMESRKWLSHLLKGLTNPTIWYKTIAPLAAVRGSVPILHWVVASVLLPGTNRFGYTGLSIDPRVLLSTFVRKNLLWSTTLRKLTHQTWSTSEQPLLSLFTAKWVDSIYQQFLNNRIRLKEFDSWVTKIVSVDIEWLLKEIFLEGRSKANQDWAESFRIPLKEIQIASKVPGINTVRMLEAATGKSLEDIFSLLSEAESKLPLIPDFSEPSLSAIIPEDEGGENHRDQQLRKAQFRAMLRIASLIQMLEGIGAGAPKDSVPGPETRISLEEKFQPKS